MQESSPHRAPGAPARRAPPVLSIDPATRTVHVDGRPLQLNSRAFDVLALLAARPGQVFDADEILRAVWPERRMDPSNLRVQIGALRRALGSDAVRNVAGRGYLLAHPVQLLALQLRPAPPRLAAPPAGEQLLGRDGDISHLQALLDTHRVVTVLGAGGIGKTRLAQRVARQRGSGIAWVDLALQPADAGAAALAQAIAVACGLQVPGLDGSHGVQALGAALAAGGSDAAAEAPALLLLDNAEHVVQPLRALLAVLLQAAPGLHVLATSQLPLHVPGEQAWWLEPLAVPAADADDDAIAASPAVQLLLRRARAADQRWELPATERAAAARLVRLLDGIPLAIEMAAARLPLFGAAGLERRLAGGLRLLGTASDALPARHRTMLAALDWSHGLLSSAEQQALHQLSVFAAPFRLEAAADVVAIDGLDRPAVEQVIHSLAERSMLHLAGGGAEGAPPRLRLLETTRLYAAEALRREGDAALQACERRHGEAMAALARQACAHFHAAGDAEWQAHWLPDQQDWLQAFDRAHGRGDATVAAAIIEALVLGANVTGQLGPALQRWQATRDLAATATPAARARLLGWGNLASGAAGSRRAQSEQRVQAWRALPPLQGHQGLAVALAMHAVVCQETGDPAAADAALDECQQLESPAWPARLRRRCTWIALTRLAIDRHDAALLARAEACSAPLMAELQQLGAWREVTLMQGQHALMLRLQGRAADAAALLQETAALQLRLGCGLDAGRSWGQACAALLRTQPVPLADAQAAARRALALVEPYPAHLHYFVEPLAELAWLRGQAEAAAQLLAAGARLRRELQVAADPLSQQAAQALRQQLAQALDDAALARCTRAGEALDAAALRIVAQRWA